jgi:predicted ATPase/DNA-binding CsgD family transcriptional regulator
MPHYDWKRLPFIGRRNEISTLVSLLRRPEAGVITVTGVPGIGKTRLVLEVCDRLERGVREHSGAAAAPMTCVLVPLAELGDAAGIPSAVAAARAAGRCAAGPADAAPAMRELLVLDNAEHLGGAARAIGALLGDSGATRILVTSVHPLGMAGEHILRLGPLDGAGLPAAGAPAGEPLRRPDDAAARGNGCVEIFLQRARAASAAFSAADGDVRVITEVCGLLGGIPLAIELAAAHLAGLPPSALLAQLRAGTGLELLRAPRGAPGPQRHESMRQALAWSFSLLDPRAQELLAALAVFPGSFTRAGAAEVAAAASSRPPGSDSPDELADLLIVLVDYHFVEPVADAGVPARYRLLPLIRQFARHQLGACGRSAVVHQRWLELVQASGRVAGTHFSRGEYPDAFALLEYEWSAVTAAIARLLADDRPQDGLRLAVDCAPYLLHLGYDAAARVRLEQLIERVRRRGDGDTPEMTRALLWSAVLTRLRPDAYLDAEWARARLAEGTCRARAAADADALLLGLEFTALSTTVTGDFAGAATAVEEGITLTSGGHDEGRLARFEAIACTLAQQRGELALADQLGADATRRASRCGDDKALLLAAIAVLGLPETAPATAVRLLPGFDELTALARRIRDRHAENFLLAAEASRQLAAGRDGPAADRSVQHLSLLMVRDELDTVALGFSVAVLTVVAARRGAFVTAARLYGGMERMAAGVDLASTPAKRAALRSAVETARRNLGTARWERERSAGGALSPEEVARAALAFGRSVAASAGDPGAGGRRAAAPAGLDIGRVIFARRELEVLRLLAAGKTNKVIAAELGLTAKTVMHYSSAVYQKIGVRGRTAATAWAVRSGLAGPTD